VLSSSGHFPHLEVTRGSPEQASDYCKDPDKRHPDHRDFLFEVGVLPTEHQGANQGKRNDILAIKRRLDDGTQPLDLAASEPELFGGVIKFLKAYQSYSDHLVKPRAKSPIVVVLYGDTGCGKSLATKGLEHAYYVPVGSSGTAWFNGYLPNKHRVVVINDFTGARMSLSELLLLCDSTPWKVNIKGGFAEFKPEMIIITANDPPRQWYGFDDPQKTLKHPWEALERRLTHIWEYRKKPFNPAMPQHAYGYAFCEKGNPKFHRMVLDGIYRQMPGEANHRLFSIPAVPEFEDDHCAEDETLWAH